MKRFVVFILIVTAIPGLPITPFPKCVRAGDNPAPRQSSCTALNLATGENVEHELSFGDVHCYSVLATAGQFIHLVVMQDGIDVVVTVKSPKGEQILEVDSPNSRDGPEPVSVIAESTGSYQIEVRALEQEAPTGHYRISLQDLRQPTPVDRQRVAVERTLAEAEQLHAGENKESLLKALDKYNEALPVLRAIGDRWKEAETVTVIGRVYFLLGEMQKALQIFEEALTMWRSFDGQIAKIDEATTLNSIATTYSALGQTEKGLQSREKALAIYRQLGNQWGEAYTLRDIGNSYIEVDQEKALDYMNGALTLARQTRNRRLEEQVLTYMGIVCSNYGQPELALKYSNEALEIQRAIGDKWMQGRSFEAIARTYSRIGEPQEALTYLEASISIFRSTGNRLSETYTLADLADQYLTLGELELAGDYYTRALTIAREIENRPAEVYALSGIASLNRAKGENQKALDCLNQILALEKQLGRPEVYKAATFSKLGAIYISLDMNEIALSNLEEALRLYRNKKNDDGQASTLCQIADLYVLENKAEAASKLLDEALSLFRMHGERGGEARALYVRAKAERSLNQLDQAEASIETAVKLLEQIRRRLYDKALRTSLSASNEKYYELQLQILMDRHRAAPNAGYERTALQVSEKARAQTLLETLRESNADIREGIDGQLLQRERLIQHRLNAKAEWLVRLISGTHTAEQEAKAKEELDAVMNEYRDVETEIRLKSPHYAALMQPPSISADQIQNKVLDENTLLLEYALGSERSYLFAVTPHAIKSYELPKRDEIEKEGKHVYDLLHKKADALDPEALIRLSRLLLGPVADELATKRLVIVSNGSLQYVPFSVLPDPVTLQANAKSTRFEPLVKQHEIVTLPSASVLALQRQELENRRAAPKKLIVFADPVFNQTDPRVTAVTAHSRKQEQITDKNFSSLSTSAQRSASELGMTEFPRLPFSRREAKLITEDVPKQRYTTVFDFAANHGAATSRDLSGYQIIHFATHGLLNNQHPDLSGVVLSLVDEDGQQENGFLRLNEIYNLKLNADLVVLSACQTALGKDVEGEGLIGLTRGFMYAGSRRVVASLWKVSDTATAELMKRFYEKMIKENMSASKSLQAAQISMMKEKQWAAPYFWAGFVIQGDWK